MSLKTHYISLDKIAYEYHQQLLDDSSVLKISSGSTGKLMRSRVVPDIVVGGESLFELALSRATDCSNPTAIVIREDHPMFSWVVLLTQL